MKKAHMTVAETIIDQLGGTGRLSAMIGAKDFVSLSEPGRGGVQFSFKGSSKTGNSAHIILTSGDLYDVEFWYVRGMNFKEVAHFEGLMWDQLIPTFEKQTKMYLSL